MSAPFVAFGGTGKSEISVILHTPVLQGKPSL